MLNRLEKFGLNLVVYAKLLNTSTIGLGFISLLTISRANLRFSIRELIFIGAVLFQLVFSLISSASSAALTNTLFYFSFLITYIFLKEKNSGVLIDFLRYLMLAMFVFSLVEFVILNSPFTYYVWYFPADHPHRALVMGLQKALGLASVSSSSGSVAVLCLALYSIVSNKNLIYFGVIVFATIVLLMSGTGFFTLFFYILMVNLKNNGGVLRKLILLMFVISIFVSALYFFDEIGLDKFTLSYFTDIVKFKIGQYEFLENTLDTSISSIIFGGQTYSENPIIETTHDFGIVGLYNSMGVVSVFLLLLAPILLVGYEKKYIVVLILYLMSWVHYPSLGSPVGCVFLGIFLALYRNNRRNELSQKSPILLRKAV